MGDSLRLPSGLSFLIESIEQLVFHSTSFNQHIKKIAGQSIAYVSLERLEEKGFSLEHFRCCA